MKDSTKPYMAEQISGEWIVTTLAHNGIDTRTFACCGRGHGAEEAARQIADILNRGAATPQASYPDLKTVAYMHADCNDFVSVSPYSYADHRELVVRSDVIEGYEAMRRDVAFWRASLDAVLKDRPAAAPEPVAWINGHDLRLLGRQGRGALVWCDKEGHADTPLYLHPPATAPEQPSWQDAPTCAGVWMCHMNGEAYQWPDKNLDVTGTRWFGPILEDKP